MDFTITGILESSSWFRLVVALICLFYSLSTMRQFSIPNMRSLAAIPLIMIGREILSFFLHVPGIFNLTDAAMYLIIVYWITSYTGNRRPANLIAGIAIPLLVLFQVLAFATDEHLRWSVFQEVVAIGIVIAAGVLMNDVSQYNTSQPEFIIDNRTTLFISMLVPKIFSIFTAGHTGQFPEYFLIPLSIVPYMTLLYRYHRFFNKQAAEQLEYNSSYINSLFDFMRTIGSAMTQRIEVKSILNYVVRTIVNHTQAEAGAVFLRDAATNTLSLAVVEGFYPPPFPVPAIVKTKLSGVERYFENTSIKVGETVLGEAAEKREAVFIRTTADDPRMEVNTKDDTLSISSLIAVPLFVNNDVYGVLSIIMRTKNRIFSNMVYERFKIFSEYASLTLDSLYNYSQLLEKQEIEREVNIAGDIQKKLLPNRVPKQMRKNIAAFSKPAKGVSGDYYDVIPLTRSGKIGMVVCDVAGKGVPASLIMVMIRTIIHLIAGSTKDPSRVVTWINRGIAGSIDIERFATLSYFTYDPETMILEYSNAGHHPLVLLRASTGEVEKIDAPGLPIGLERDAKYERRAIKLAPGDLVMVYTDGIIESMNPDGEQYEEERLQKVFRESVGLDAASILAAIREDLDDFVGSAKQHDDQTLIVMKT